MSREWQQTKYKEYVMPDAVYYQSIWAVRDLSRMENRLEELKNSSGDCTHRLSMVREGGKDLTRRKPTENRAMEIVVLEERVKGIRKALELVPKNYRPFVLSNIILKNSGTGFPDKVWRMWKQKFLFNVAKNLSMI